MELTANEEMELTAGEGAELATGRGTGLTTELGVALTNLPSEHHRSPPTRCDYRIRKCHSNIPNAPHHLVHYKKEGIVLIIRKILTELRMT